MAMTRLRDSLFTGSMAFMSLCGSLPIALLVAIMAEQSPEDAVPFALELFSTGAYFLLSLMMAWGSYHHRRGPLPRWFAAGSLVLLGVILPIIMAPRVRDMALESAFRESGLRVDRDAPLIEVSAPNDALLRAVAARHGTLYSSCEIEGSTNRLVAGLDVDWHGIGSRSLVRFAGAPKASRFTLQPLPLPAVELDASGMHVVRTQPGLGERCLTLSADALFFDTNSSTLSPQADDTLKAAKAQIEAFVRQLRSQHDDVRGAGTAASAPGKGQRPPRFVQVEVIGHADPMPRAKGSNHELSLQRAQAVATWLKAELAAEFGTQWTPAASGRGSLHAKTQCPTTMAVEQQRECHAASRRVELRVTLSARP